jgi:signal transduction histidine kinase
MENQDKQPMDIRQAVGSPEKFFQEIEIEFLIHELKDPLAIIETGVRTLLDKRDRFGPLTERQETTLRRTLRNSKKVRQMLNNLLEIGRSGAGCFICDNFQPAQSALRALSDALETTDGAVFGNYRTFGREHEALEYLASCGIYVDINKLVRQIEMYQDETKFRQIVGNLLKNALHHRNKRLVLKMKLVAEQLIVDVSDDGPGVDPAHHELIFLRYAQVKECSMVSRKGHGLGLAGASILARCMGGSLELESEMGKGATFRLTMPLRLTSS